MTRRTHSSHLVTLTAAVAVLLGGCQVTSTPTEDTGASPSPTSEPAGEAGPGDLLPGASAGDEPTVVGGGERPSLGSPGIPECDVLDLPATTLETIDDIEAGGPYDHPRNDGVRFQNREGILPDEDRDYYRDYYREFTVETPGLDHRGARRIVTGGFTETDPEHWFYTGDHYESFCEFAPELMSVD